MINPSSPTDLPTVRITGLFPFPVEGRDVTVFLKNSSGRLERLGLTPAPERAEDIDPRVDFSSGPYRPDVFVFSASDGGRWLVVPDGDGHWLLAQLPLEEADYEAGDRVYSRLNPELPYCIGTVTSLCPRPIMSAHWCAVVKWEWDSNPPSACPIKDIALFNNFTPPRPRRPA